MNKFFLLSLMFLLSTAACYSADADFKKDQASSASSDSHAPSNASTERKFVTMFVMGGDPALQYIGFDSKTLELLQRRQSGSNDIGSERDEKELMVMQRLLAAAKSNPSDSCGASRACPKEVKNCTSGCVSGSITDIEDLK